MDSSNATLPPLKNLTIDNITDNVNLINSTNPSLRFKFVLERLVQHLHDFVRETRLSSEEWMAGLQFLTATGQICTDVRQEFILLSDVLGLSLLVDSIDHPKLVGSTEGTVLGPFHTHDAEHLENGCVMSHDQNGEPLLVICMIRDTKGNPIEDVKIDIWETDSSGKYDVQHEGRDKPDGRCVLTSGKDGKFWFKAIVPIPYPIPHDGPVGQLLLKLNRHPMRPSHMHFKFEKDGWDSLITALYLRGDPYETSDAVFGVKDTLVVDLDHVDEEMTREYGVEQGTKLLRYDFVLVTKEESANLREQRSREALGRLGMRVKIVEGMPIPDID